MTFPSLVWMLTECGHVMPLPPGTAGADALQTGPIYELVLRSQPSIKLIYTHSPSSNVNAKASTLAGHSVNGDACLVFIPNPASFASPAVLLKSLLQLPSSSSSACKQHLPAMACARSANSRGHSVPYLRQESSLALQAAAAQCKPGDSAAAPLQHVKFSPSPEQQLHTTYPFTEKSIASVQQRQRQQDTHACPQQRQLAMRAILGSRNATTTVVTNTAAPITSTTAAVSTAPPPCSTATMCTGPTPTAIGVSPIVDHVQGRTASLPAVVASAGPACLSRRPSEEVEQPPCKSARSSGEFHQPRPISGSGPDPWVAVRGAESFFACGEPLQTVLESQSPALFLDSMADEHQERGRLPQQQAGFHTLGPRLAENSGTASMKLDGDEEEGAPRAGDKARNTGERVRAEYGVPELAPSELGAADETDGAVMDAAVDVPWGEMASDAIICVAMQLPQLASQVLAMAAVCRGWRAALLGHSPLLRRVAFSLDLSRPLRTAGPSSPVAAASAYLGACPGMLSERGAADMPQSAALTCAVPAGSVSELSPHVRDDSDLLAAAMSRQHSRGAFLLPSHGTRPPDEEEQHHVKQVGRGDGAQSLTYRACLQAPDAAPAVTLLQRIMEPSKPLPMPGLLLAAAHASNPSAQLVLAQLLEVGWVVMR
ncbi:hypothetical protein Vretifemale_3174 [Volvox reticuliferus]|uniref:Uncharacterized protein n=1 Tax=Volvox reticuliferus TaxID=1737510 RepID=A0A8J4C1X9_9CHLO|nr:hypothetical protein Vretifemale_3174 [Volvox reticuliferus]